MLKYAADRFQSHTSALSLDTEALKRYPDMIDLSIGDTDIITDKRIIDAAFRDACAGYTRYGDPKGDPELIEAVCKAWREDYDQTISPKEVVVTTSSCMGMAQVMLGLLNPGDEVLVFGPYFSPYKDQIEMAGGKAVEVVTYAENSFFPQEEDVRAAITNKTKAFIINTPNNPTGTAYDLPTLQMLARLAQEFDLLAVADEIYTRYLYDGMFIPMRTLPGMADRTITLNSFSKNFMMTGWRVGYIIAHPDLISVFQHINNGMTYVTPSISQRAALYALTIRQDIAEKYISVYRNRVYYAYERISQIPWLSIVKPRGTFYLFPRIDPAIPMKDGEFCKYLIENAHLLVSAGSAFGLAGQGHFRIAATVPQEKLAVAMDRLAALEPPLK
ncbi:MAG: aminotransferase class I/II-fold pyridoxal phosphate-dependent enzyme [Clostridia bacterium]|nr:aminotransferase class I/II-fold pyridoxal phosphate-dependent enzyme [Clostridia bacterium]